MIKLIVGLGNPGQEYNKTRHNAGFLFLDQLQNELVKAESWSYEAKFQGRVLTTFIDTDKLILLQPQTFMNRSGLSVAAIARFYRLECEQILVVHDELDLSIGAIRLKKGGGHAGHNGLKDIISCLGSKEFYRLRIGISRPKPGIKVANYVLSKLGKKESELVDLAILQGISQIKKIMAGDFSSVMNVLNQKQ